MTNKGLKNYEELTLKDDFIFFATMVKEELCRGVLERIIGIKIKELVYISGQEFIKNEYESKAIRLDIYAKDVDDAVYNVELQVANEKNLPQRSRYYQSNIDIELLGRGEEYEEINQCYIIFICAFDPFKGKRKKYTFNNVCNEDKECKLEDGVTKLFLNLKGKVGEVSEELDNLIEYFNTGIVKDDFIEKLDNHVSTIKRSKDWRRRYMFYGWKVEADRQDARKAGRAEGREEGRAEGRKEGREEGREEGEAVIQIRNIIKMYSRRMVKDDIYDILEIEKDMLDKVYDIIDNAERVMSAEEIYERYIVCNKDDKVEVE